MKGEQLKSKTANISLRYQKEESAWAFGISGTNILGSAYNHQNSITDFLVKDERSYLLPKIWMLTVSLKL